MGYCVDLVDSNFKIKKEDAESILTALKEFASKCGGLMWADDEYILNSKNIEDCFEELRYTLADMGDYYGIDYFNGEKLGDEEKIFNSIANYIEKGTYLEYVGEDGERFRLVFDGKKCEYKYPTLIWK